MIRPPRRHWRDYGIFSDDFTTFKVPFVRVHILFWSQVWCPTSASLFTTQEKRNWMRRLQTWPVAVVWQWSSCTCTHFVIVRPRLLFPFHKQATLYTYIGWLGCTPGMPKRTRLDKVVKIFGSIMWGTIAKQSKPKTFFLNKYMKFGTSMLLYSMKYSQSGSKDL